MTRRAALRAAAALGAVAMGAAWAVTRAAHRPALPAREAGLNVLLVTIDTLRADALGCYGNARAATPWIDRLAAAGVRFAQAQAHNVVTLPSHANILTGRLPLAHGVRDNAGFRLPSDVETLATTLSRHGYRTGAFVSAFTLDSRFGLDRGFDVYDDAFTSGAVPAAFELPERRGGGHGGRRAAVDRRGRRAPVLRLGAPLRSARPLRAAASRSRRASPRTATWARWRPRTPRWSRCWRRCWSGARRAARWWC